MHLSSFSLADVSTSEQNVDELINLYVGILVHKTLQTHPHTMQSLAQFLQQYSITKAVISAPLIKELQSSGYGTHLSSLYIGSILYADDICLISHSCFGLQKMLDICYNYGVTWDILFNPVKSHLMAASAQQCCISFSRS